VCERGARGVFAPEVRAGWGEGEEMGVRGGWGGIGWGGMGWDGVGWGGMGWVGR